MALQVYITSDIGLAEQKFNEYKPKESIYVIGDEQNYHLKVLKLIAEKLKAPWCRRNLSFELWNG
jgi:arginyl-tRNA synthetase